jgi:hypothetical protein
MCEHLQKPHNVGSRPHAQFFNTLLIQKDASAADGALSGPPAAKFFTQQPTGKSVQKERP